MTGSTARHFVAGQELVMGRVSASGRTQTIRDAFAQAWQPLGGQAPEDEAVGVDDVPGSLDLVDLR